MKITLPDTDIAAIRKEIVRAHEILCGDTYGGFTGWLNLPRQDPAIIADIKKTALYIRNNADALIVLGTGGSLFGAAAVIDLLNGVHHNVTDTPQIFFFGHALDGDEIEFARSLVREKRVVVNLISKSGTTLEPNVAFNALRAEMAKKYSDTEISERIIYTVGEKFATLAAGCAHPTRFNIPDDVGGRYSVLSPVGLLPIAAAGIDIDALLRGAKQCADDNCFDYAAARAMHARQKYAVDLFALTNPNAANFGAWLCQLFAESEGKDGRGVFPATTIFPRDLHSLGQFIQDGPHILFETVVHFRRDKCADVETTRLNNVVYESAVSAHRDGGVPVATIEVGELDARTVGELIYFFEKSCAMYCIAQGVNPFNQPGVEKYKSNVKKLLRT